MKNLAMISTIIMAAFIISCENDTPQIDKTSQNMITEEVLQKISSLDLNTSDVEFRTIKELDGSEKDVYIIEGYCHNTRAIK